ncbi:MAG: hypothetical protein HKL95_07785 [Phycisphaerae bacterium]|nr:hypothetical protein [Phycisphaerae bacterium]
MDTQTACDTRTLLILTALKAEYQVARAVVKQWQLDTPTAIRAAAYENIVVEQIGMGGCFLKEILPRYYHSQVTGVVTAGLAGACSPELAVGDLVIDSNSHEALRVEEIINAMSNGQRCVIGPIHTSKHMVGDTAQKKELFVKGKFIAVDMENKATSQFAQRRNVPWIGLRTISDTAMDSLPGQIAQFMDPAGNVRPLALTITIAANPRIIGNLMRLGKASNIASRKLAEAIGAVIRSGWPFHA